MFVIPIAYFVYTKQLNQICEMFSMTDFLCFRSFWHEIIINKMSIHMDREIYAWILFSKSHVNMIRILILSFIYKSFCEFAPDTVKKYFDNEWHSLREQCTIGIKFSK